MITLFGSGMLNEYVENTPIYRSLTDTDADRLLTMQQDTKKEAQ